MSGGHQHPLTVRWVLFGFRGRIARKSFLLAGLGMILVQAAITSQILGVNDDSPEAVFWALTLLAAMAGSVWVLLALAVKRLHDIGWPGLLALLLLVPGISWIALLVLAVWPSVPNTNEHGPPPFPRGR